jgi:ribosome recycling factor
MMTEAALKDAQVKMSRSIEHLEHELASIRTGRAAPGLIENIRVDYYGTPTPLNQLAQISTPEARLLVVQVYDRSQVAAVEKAIRTADLGLNPANDGQVIRVPIPALTEERRREYVRLVKERAEEARVAVRNVRREELHRIDQQSREGGLSEDAGRRLGKRLQDLTDTHVGEVDTIASRKESEVMAV